MKCPKCEKIMREGIIEAKDAGSMTQSLTQIIWYPEEYSGKMIKKEVVDLKIKETAYYCDDCMEVIATFHQR